MLLEIRSMPHPGIGFASSSGTATRAVRGSCPPFTLTISKIGAVRFLFLT